MAETARPLTLGEILDRTVQLYRRNFLLLVGIATPPAALIVLLSGSVALLFTSRIAQVADAAQAGAIAPASPQDALVIVLVVVLFLLIGLPLILGIFAMALAALNYAVSQVNRGESTTLRASYAYAFRYFWRHVGVLFLQCLFAAIIPYAVFVGLFAVGAMLFALVASSGGAGFATIVLGVVMVLGIVALAVVCVLIWLRLSLAFPVSVAEDAKAWASLKRSNRLTQGTRGRIFVMFLLVLVLAIVVSVALILPLDLVVTLTMRRSLTSSHMPGAYLTFLQVVNLAVGFLVRIFVMPIYVTALMLFYTDQRTRLEGYDIEQLMTQAGWGELPLPPSAPPESPALPATSEGDIVEGTGA